MCNSIVIDFNPVIRELYYLNDRCTDFIFAIILLMISHFIALWLVTLGIIVIFKNEFVTEHMDNHVDIPHVFERDLYYLFAQYMSYIS